MRYLVLLLFGCFGCNLTYPPQDTKTKVMCEPWCAEVTRMDCFREWGIEEEDGTCLEACADLVKDDDVCLRLKANNCSELDEYECS